VDSVTIDPIEFNAKGTTMKYFVTGGTGFIGRFLVGKLLQRGGTVYVLAREGSQHKLEALRTKHPGASDRIVGVLGDLSRPGLGLSGDDRDALRGEIDHFFHAAAVYDLEASAESNQIANVEGTAAAIACAEAIEAGLFHHVSSISVSGLYEGTFREDMFEEAGRLPNAYARTKHESEALVRSTCGRPWRIYRPAGVVGHSQTGEIDKIDGPYYALSAIKKLRNALPAWAPLIGIDSGRLNIVPVDYIVDAMDHIAHKDGLDGRCFHLVDPDHHTFGELFNTFAEAAGAPRMAMRFDTSVFKFIPTGFFEMAARLPPVKRTLSTALDSIGLPADAATMFRWNTRFDNRETEAALRGSGIEVPRLASYADKLWDYWRRNLDPDLFVDRSLKGGVGGRVVVITGAGSGIGRASALRLASAGATVIMAGRKLEKLEAVKQTIEAAGGVAYAYAADIADPESCDGFIGRVLNEHGHVDVLVNNAGRSIRRSIERSFERFHDYERTMQVNYFGALRLTLGFLPGMSERRSGQIVNVSSMGVVGPPARFSAYIASKSALEGFSRVAEAEFIDRGIAFTNVNMPLVRTPMIGPTGIYEFAPTLSPEQAADLVVEAILHKPSRVTTSMGKFMQVLGVIAPKLMALAMNATFRMFDDSNAAKGLERSEKLEPTNEQVAVAALMKGVHF
jgi:NAD(P)-dependent dehydrogenase (short-subunit alcohol dehydrogenase family)